jgi:hypothetical protein
VSEISKHSALREFRLQLIKKIILKYGNQKRISIGRPTIDSPSHLSARHFRSLVSSTASKAAVQRKVMYGLIQKRWKIGQIYKILVRRM